MPPRNVARTLLAALVLSGCGDDQVGPAGPYLAKVHAMGAAPSSGVTDLSETGSTTSTVTLSWTQVDDGTGEPAWYRVKYSLPPIDYRTAAVGCDRSLPGDEVGAEMSCTVEGLERARRYEFQLMSFRIVDGQWADAVYSNRVLGSTAVEPAGAPTVVADLAVKNASAHSVKLGWTQVDDGAGEPAWYRVKYAAPPLDYRTATVGCDRTIPGTAIGAEMTCTVDGLPDDSAYEFQLMSYRMVDGVWVDAKYSNRTLTRTPPYAPNAVTDLKISARSHHSLTVHWKQVDDGTGRSAWYQVKYAKPPIDYDVAQEACAFEGTLVGAEAACLIDDLEYDADYEVQLMSFRLVDGAPVDGVRSNIVGAATSAEATGPVDDLSVVGSRSDAVVLRWHQVDDGRGYPASYRLRYGAPLEAWKDGFIGCEPIMHGTAIGAEATCTVTGLKHDTPYDFQLMSFRIDDGVWTDARYSNLVGAWVPLGLLPTVEDLEVVGASSSTLTLRWTQINDGSRNPESAHAAWYQVRYAPRPFAGWSNAVVGCGPVIEGDRVGAEMLCTITGLEPGTSYDAQLASFWVEDDSWRDVQYSNIATGATTGGA